MSALPQGRFIRFARREPRPARTTCVVDIYSRKTGEHEGTVRWYGRRGYSLFADDGKPFGPICLGDVVRLCDYLNAEHRAEKLFG